jgi:hypothetical protein
MDGWKVLERAKSKRQTEPRTKEKSEAEHLFQCGTMTQISPQDTFRTLLSFLKSEPLNWLAVPLHCPSLASAEHRDKFMKRAPDMVRVMESEIFYNGGLKGWHLHGDHYESYPIRDLDQFIYDLSYLLSLYEVRTGGWQSEFQAHAFSEAVRHLKLFIIGVRMYKGKRAMQPFKTIMSQLKTIGKEVSTKPDSPLNVSKSALKQELVDIFHRHIQAPSAKETMAIRSAELLMSFNISATPEGMRDYFKNK